MRKIYYKVLAQQLWGLARAGNSEIHRYIERADRQAGNSVTVNVLSVDTPGLQSANSGRAAMLQS